MNNCFLTGQLVRLHKGYVGNNQNLLELPVCFVVGKKAYRHLEYYLVPTDSPFMILKIEDGYTEQAKVVIALCGDKIIKVHMRHLEIFTEASNV